MNLPIDMYDELIAKERGFGLQHHERLLIYGILVELQGTIRVKLAPMERYVRASFMEGSEREDEDFRWYDLNMFYIAKEKNKK